MVVNLYNFGTSEQLSSLVVRLYGNLGISTGSGGCPVTLCVLLSWTDKTKDIKRGGEEEEGAVEEPAEKGRAEHVVCLVYTATKGRTQTSHPSNRLYP